MQEELVGCFSGRKKAINESCLRSFRIAYKRLEQQQPHGEEFNFYKELGEVVDK